MPHLETIHFVKKTGRPQFNETALVRCKPFVVTDDKREKKERMTTMRKRREAPEFELMLRAMAAGPMTVKDVAVELGITARNATHYVRAAHEDGLVHVASWAKKDRGPWYPVYVLGDDLDAVSPPKKTIADRRADAAARKQRSRQDVEVWLKERNQKRAARASAKLVEAR